jgi:hypothetical protein
MPSRMISVQRPIKNISEIFLEAITEVFLEGITDIILEGITATHQKHIGDLP